MTDQEKAYHLIDWFTDLEFDPRCKLGGPAWLVDYISDRATILNYPHATMEQFKRAYMELYYLKQEIEQQ